jgi:hypothetical protein
VQILKHYAIDELPDIKVLKFVVDRQGTIFDINTPVFWNHFLKSNTKSPTFLAKNCIGKNLFEDVLKGYAVQEIYKRLFNVVLDSPKDKTITFGWYCDSSNIERQMIMTITKHNNDKVLVSSRIYREQALVCVQDYLDAHFASTDNQIDDRIFSICSYCKRIRVSMLDSDLPHIADGIIVEPTGEAVKLPGQIFSNFGARGKQGHTIDSQNTMVGNTTHVWLPAVEWQKVKERYMISFILHDICTVCRAEWDNYLSTVEHESMGGIIN